MRWNFVWTALTLFVMGCAGNGGEGGGSGGVAGDGGSIGAGGSGGEGGSGGRGGSGGTWGTGGVGGSGGTWSTGGAGGEVGGSGGTGGEGGVVDYGWLADPEIWSEVDIEDPPTAFSIFAGDPTRFEFPELLWREDCGHGCSSARLKFGEITGDVVVGTEHSEESERPNAYAVVSHYFHDVERRTVRRVVSLTGGDSRSALNFFGHDPDHTSFVHGVRMEDAGIFLVLKAGDAGDLLWVAYGPETGWDFKSPWHHERQYATWCHPFSLAADPPVAFFGCGNGLHVMKERGSSVTTIFPGSERTAVGSANDGVAVWAEHPAGGARISRIRAWSPDEEIRTIKEFPGDVCGLAVGPSHIAGFRGDYPDGSGLCLSVITQPRFFWISRDDGEVKEGPLLPASEMVVPSMSTTEDFTAALSVLSPWREIPHEERIRVTLIRHDDGKMRQFAMPPAGYSMGKTTVALDEDYLYFTRWNATPGDHSFDAVYRYRLDLFDEIGLPYPPPDLP